MVAIDRRDKVVMIAWTVGAANTYLGAPCSFSSSIALAVEMRVTGSGVKVEIEVLADLAGLFAARTIAVTKGAPVVVGVGRLR